MINVLTNVRLDTKAGNPCIKDNKSLIGFDFSSVIPEYEIKKEGKNYKIRFHDVLLNMPSGSYAIDDGIINKIFISSNDNNVEVKIDLLMETSYEIESIDGIPAKLNFFVDRTPLKNILKGKKIILNPVYKKTTKSPTNLSSHIPMMDISKKTKELLTLLEADALISMINYSENISNSDFKGDVIINLTTEISTKNESGFKVYYDKDNEKSKKLAELMNKSIDRKSPLDNLGMHPTKYNGTRKGAATVTVIPGIENSRLDDAHLRDIDYKSKIALAIFNGILAYFK
ncbi:N-acetylmuramoyl-L-alanine amidase [Thermoanaerobacterium thermosaccharolyticum]|uniref:N-acetylmuramoyl-L-alanine amidase family protein n=1 Tax=Thermoanaerobacterium thermosaccharolyticum TaxID=1517 RepID=UPI003D2D67F8